MAHSKIEGLKKIIEIDPNDEVAYFGLGKALMDEGQFAEAAGYLETCVKVKPTYSAAYLALVESLLRINQKDRARQYLQEGHAVSLKGGDMQVTKKLEAIQQTLT
jgi:tetratricopeptide (TPR) repeat protein